MEQADGLDRVFAHHITNKTGKYIVFCANKEHMDEMVSHVPEWFAGVNPDVVVYQAYSDDPNTDKAFADFKTDTSNRLKLLFCIDMLNEGVHVEGISGVILFRPTISPIIYKAADRTCPDRRRHRSPADSGCGQQFRRFDQYFRSAKRDAGSSPSPVCQRRGR